MILWIFTLSCNHFIFPSFGVFYKFLKAWLSHPNTQFEWTYCFGILYGVFSFHFENNITSNIIIETIF